MTPAPPPTDAARAARADFHVALAAVLVPILSVPLTLLLALRHRSELRGPDAAARTWTRRLWLVVAIDLVWPILLVASLSTGGAIRALGAGHTPKARIGVIPSDAKSGPIEVRGLVPGRPAERAGIKVGDVIEKVGDLPVDGMSSLLLLLATAEAGKPVELTLRRGAETVPISVIPEAPESGHPSYKLFEPLPVQSPPGRRLWWDAAMALPLLGIWLWARRRSTPPAGADLAAGFIAAAIVASIAAERLASSGLRKLLGSLSLGTMLISLSVATLAMLGVALIGRSLLSRRGLLGPQVEPKPPAGTALRALLYSYALSVRISLLVTATLWLSGRDIEPSVTMVPRELAGLLDRDGVLLLALPVVMIGPVAEEVLFRGLLLPWLRNFSSERVALWLSAGFFALVHIHYGAHLFSILPIGLALGWARLRSNGLAAPILAHTAINGLVVLAVAARAGG